MNKLLLPKNTNSVVTIDARSLLTSKILDTGILPHISRRALAKVTDPLPIPTCCNLCNGKVELKNNSAVYRGRSYGDWPFVYLCLNCGSYVGLHPNTDLPLGYLANEQTRKYRKSSKTAFINFSKTRRFSRSESYSWLASRMNKEIKYCHFAMFDVSDCKLVLEIIKREAK